MERIHFPMVDAHLHVWDPEKIHYPWLEQNAFLKRAFLLADYDKACGDICVERMVFVQCEASFSQYMEELRWVTELAERDPRIGAIIPWAPLEMGESVRDILDVIAENRLVKGIRRIIEFEKDPDFCLRPDFIKGVRALAAYDFSFDVNIAHHQMDHATRLVRQCPEVRFILDHAGKPDIKGQQLASWKESLRTFSEMPNTYCKISGLVTEARWKNWSIEDLRPYIEHVLDCFGFDRVVYGGDWPVMCQAAEYIQWADALYSAVKDCSPEERRKLFHDNAIKFYRLEI